ncbi:MAG TPA: phosphatase domain-containing protein [Gemmatimonadales bacterium]|nr:phosphatase domain-containing protein [Gemmatimonadales bacterium]
MTERPTLNRWTRLLAEAMARTEDGIDTIRRVVGSTLAPSGPPRPLLYRSFGTTQGVRVIGRVVRDAEDRPAGAGDGPMRNLLAAVRRFESEEVRGATVRIQYGDRTAMMTTDAEGYFDGWLEGPQPLPGARWQPVSADVVAPEGAGAGGLALVPPASARVSVISDLDDTVIRTGVGNLFQLAASTLLANARTRLPFPGVAELYRALADGAGGNEGNPISYVSSGPWHLHDVVVEFLDARKIPLGPVQLRDWGTDRERVLGGGHRIHKLAAIDRVAAAWPNLPMILVGDSGQHDPEVYIEALKRYGERVRAIYIRDVTGPERRAAVVRLCDTAAELGAEMLLAPGTASVAAHAASRGWIAPDQLASIRESAG